MKKVIVLLYCLILIVSLAACGSGENAGRQGRITAEQGAQTAVEKAPDIAIASQPQAERDSIDLEGRLEFSAQTVGGDPVDSSIFQEYQLTMINIWGTLCKPCIEEMPELEALYQEMRDSGVNVMGFVANVLGEDGDITQRQRSEDAVKILDAKGVTYMNIVFDDTLTNSIYGQISGFPTTIFVDGEGNVIGGQISGARSKDEYRKEIEGRLRDAGQ